MFEGSIGVLGFIISITILVALGNKNRNKSKSESKLLFNIMFYGSAIYLVVLIAKTYWKEGM